MQGAYLKDRISRLGVPEAVREKVVQLEFDSYAASLDAQRYVRDAEADRGAAITASRKLREENNAAIKQLLGEQAYATYSDRSPAAVLPARIPPSVFDPLAARLSYSGNPLDPSTRQRLLDVLQSMSAARSALYNTMPRTPDFVERARSVLQPGQVAALEELAAEYEAAVARRQLPKSSELPRTTRSERLKATAK
jgi:hypothetical protein